MCPHGRSPAELPVHLERELHLPLGRLSRRRELAGRGNDVAAAVEDLRLRHLKVRAVEEVEGFDPELQAARVVSERPVLQKGGIEVLQSWPAQRVAAQIAEPAK